MDEKQSNAEQAAERTNHLFEQVNDYLSRRGFLSNTAKVGGGAIALSAAGGTAAADGDDDDEHKGKGEKGKDKNGEDDDDVSTVEVLNFALTLEKLEATFYEEALASSGGRFDEHDIERSDAAKNFASPPLQYSTYQYLERIRDHEREHVEALTAAINDLGGEPVSGLEFEFPYETVEEFIELARVFEDTGAAAYTGAVELIDNEAYLQAAAQILAVEARHASYLRVLNSQVPFPNAFQTTLTMEQVKQRVAPFIVGMDDGGTGKAKQFRADLAGDNEVPPVDTDATGKSSFEYSTHDDDPHIHYTVRVSDIENVTQAHIHVGSRDENGPVVAFLFGKEENGEFVGPLDDGKDVSGSKRLARGTIRADDLVGPLEGENLTALLEEMRAENTYVNVHTTQNPAGEIRGQIVPEK